MRWSKGNLSQRRRRYFGNPPREWVSECKLWWFWKTPLLATCGALHEHLYIFQMDNHNGSPPLWQLDRSWKDIQVSDTKACGLFIFIYYFIDYISHVTPLACSLNFEPACRSARAPPGHRCEPSNGGRVKMPPPPTAMRLSLLLWLSNMTPLPMAVPSLWSTDHIRGKNEPDHS